MFELHQGDCRDMKDVADKSCHVCITSPPYWSLRQYDGVQDGIWGGSPDCSHVWGNEIINKTAHKAGETNPGKEGYTKDSNGWTDRQGCICTLCGAWKGGLGSEPTPEMFVSHLVEVFREVKRVLRDDGVLWVNLDDSAAGSGNGSNDYRELTGIGQVPTDRYKGQKTGNFNHPFIKPLDRCLIPERFRLAMQEDGWFCRATIIWDKPNPMPESTNGWRWEKHRIKVGNNGRGNENWRDNANAQPQQDHDKSGNFKADAHYQDCPGCPQCSPNDGLILRKGAWRPTSSHEYIFMFTKTGSYYCDKQAVMEGENVVVRRAGGYSSDGQLRPNDGKQPHSGGFADKDTITIGRNLRSVWKFPTQGFDLEICEACDHIYDKKHYHRLPKQGKKRVCRCGSTDWISHYATFPEKLPELCIKASTSEHGVCEKCGMQYARVVDETNMVIDRSDWANKSGNRTASSGTMVEPASSKTLGWKQCCKCGDSHPVPATVLDPFCGSGTTLVAANKLNRQGIGYDLSENYLKFARERLKELQPVMREI